jgi:hypothetical protein
MGVQDSALRRLPGGTSQPVGVKRLVTTEDT